MKLEDVMNENQYEMKVTKNMMSPFVDFNDGRQSHSFTLVFHQGYSLSVVQHKGSYGGTDGLWEIMLQRNKSPICLPPITNENDSVRGYLTLEEVREAIELVEELAGIPV